MKLFEYQGKEIFNNFAVPTPRGEVVQSVEEVGRAAEVIGFPLMVKAQILQGGRGKAGGIKKLADTSSAAAFVELLLSTPLKNETVEKVLLEEAVDVEQEYYVAVTIDDRLGKPLIIASSEGGVDIEELAQKSPDKISRCAVNPVLGLSDSEAMGIAQNLHEDAGVITRIKQILLNLYDVFVQKDADLVEVNPLILTKDGKLLAGDAKVIINDDALYRQDFEYNMSSDDTVQENKFEELARSKGFIYVELGGEVGIVSIGAGYGMMLLDVVNHFGCKPANFIDAKGGPSPDLIREMTNLVLCKATEDSNIKVILVSCGLSATLLDSVVLGIIDAVKAHPPRVPVVASFVAVGPATVNMSVDEASELLNKHGISYYKDFKEAIDQVVATVKGDI